MIRVTFVTFFVGFSGPVFGQVPGVTSKTIPLGQSAAFSGPAAFDLTMIGRSGKFVK